MDIINEVLDGKVKDSDQQTSSEEITVEEVVRFITEFENLKKDIYSERYDFDLDAEILRHLNESKDQQDATFTNRSLENDEELSDNEFWEPTEQNGRRIYRGDRTKIKYFPFMASVQFFQKFQCGGSIIKSDLIISAASCLQLAWNNRFFRENPSFLSVRVGSNYYATGGENIPVQEVYFHPDYNPKNLRNNLCLMRLVRRIKFRRRGRRVKKINIDRKASPLPETTDGITIVGWGAKGSSNIIGDLWANRLSFSVLDFYPLRECRDIYSSEYVTRKNFCAGFFSKGGGACNRDVGGPGIVNGRLAGVISFGSPVCGAPDAPTVFTKVGYYADWIDEIMDQDVPHTKKRTTLPPPRHPFMPPFVHTSPKPTTFKIAPLGGGVMRPVPIGESDALRVLSDDSLFNEFLNTMLNKKNIERDQKVINEKKRSSRATVATAFAATTAYVPEISHIRTQMDLEEFTTEKIKKYTALNEDFDASHEKELEKDLIKLIDDIDLKQIMNSDEDSKKEHFLSKNKLTAVKTHKKKSNVKDYKNKLQNVDDSVLTLLYLSDNEKKNGGLEDLEHGGLSIATDSFKDMTFRNNETDLFDFIPKNELYDLLTEAI
ncbi:hypothetical protein O3G_MSEX007879 [Manduca sexta]|uniref:Peptidase S1 domain-containing protein n=1 Tax=Manduca sexta TaxID=7130 RepID=A0A922CP04_MANSE|nr:hypothetical protein O3G_MSEX007879 [Manduca sexta]